MHARSGMLIKNGTGTAADDSRLRFTKRMQSRPNGLPTFGMSRYTKVIYPSVQHHEIGVRTAQRLTASYERRSYSGEVRSNPNKEIESAPGVG